MANVEAPKQTPEGRLLSESMLRHRPPWNAAELARETPFEVDWVRANVRGYRNVGKGNYQPVVPKADTLALLADALGNITETHLREIGRDDAANALRLLRADDRAEGSSPVDRLAKIRDDIDALLSDLRETRV